jgi:GAF domain-containing protein
MRGGEVLDGLFFGQPEPDVFDDRTERMVAAIAIQAAIAIDKARRGHAECFCTEAELAHA